MSAPLHLPSRIEPKPGPFNENEELALVQEALKVGDAVPAELFVLEVHGVPGSRFAVEDIDRPRINSLGIRDGLEWKGESGGPIAHWAASSRIVTDMARSLSRWLVYPIGR